MFYVTVVQLFPDLVIIPNIDQVHPHSDASPLVPDNRDCVTVRLSLLINYVPKNVSHVIHACTSPPALANTGKPSQLL